MHVLPACELSCQDYVKDDNSEMQPKMIVQTLVYKNHVMISMLQRCIPIIPLHVDVIIINDLLSMAIGCD